ncbi:hypothetical protein JAAARDRAFT_75983 [Jaapia argillacea MUCL 33604]|uniref:Expansin-like EG45 domain-containing protein n=1 Tax=Jaapia argillacea MUCL 33604 TaxID=933084 RepID=A0A067QM56_9AGAM|nr:hypothetical protein JAAARDRAFT_75983 [Jaapia argillacea MUCL 33604]
MVQLTFQLTFVLSLLGGVLLANADSGVSTFNDARNVRDRWMLASGFVSDSNGKGACTNCAGPACPGEQVCGTCYNVKCTGSLDGETSGSCSGNTIKVKIVDACPATHPANYCKIPQFGGTINPKEACEASGVNALDIATTARSALSTYKGNLNIDIEATSC